MENVLVRFTLCIDFDGVSELQNKCKSHMFLGCNHTRYKTTYNPRTRASCQGDARQIQNVTYMFSASSTPLYKATFWRFLLICESTFPVVEGSWFSASVFSFSVRVGIFISPVGLRLHQLPYLEYLNKFLSFPSA